MQFGVMFFGFVMVAVLVWLSGLFCVLRCVEGGMLGFVVVVLGGGILVGVSMVIGVFV